MIWQLRELFKPFRAPKELTDDQLQKLTPQRRKALMRSMTAKLAAATDDWLDFMPEILPPELRRLNDYRKKLRRMVRQDARQAVQKA